MPVLLMVQCGGANGVSRGNEDLLCIFGVAYGAEREEAGL